MQAERESGSTATTTLNGGGGGGPVNSSIISDVAALGLDASGDSADEDELPLLKVVGSAAAASPLSGSSLRRQKRPEKTNCTTVTLETAMKEEVAVDWLKLEPRLVPDESELMDVENGVRSLVAGGEEEEEAEDSPLLEEDVIDGFSILTFKTYEDLEVSFLDCVRVQYIPSGNPSQSVQC